MSWCRMISATKGLGSDYVFHNTKREFLPQIEKEGLIAGSFATKPIDFGGDVWIAVRKSDLPLNFDNLALHEHQYGDVVAIEPTWEYGLDSENNVLSRVVAPEKLILVNQKGKFIRRLRETRGANKNAAVGMISSRFPTWCKRASSSTPTIQGTPYYHATSNSKLGEEILHSGVIKTPDLAGRKGFLTPRKGKAYMSSSKETAAIYALGGVMMGHKMDSSWVDMQRSGAKGRYGYIFEITPESIMDVEPDEDSVGEILHHGLNKTRACPEWLISLAQNVVAPVRLDHLVAGEYIYYASVGKQLIPRMTDTQKIQLIEEYNTNVAHAGHLKVLRAWRLDKMRSEEIATDGSNLFDVAEPVTVPVVAFKATGYKLSPAKTSKIAGYDDDLFHYDSSKELENNQYEAAERATEEYDTQVSDIVRDFLQNKKKKRWLVPWSLIPASRLLKIWNDYATYGVVRDERGMDEIADRMVRNTMRLKATTEMSGHSQIGIKDVLESAGFDLTPKQIEKLVDGLESKEGEWYVSDYGLPKLEQLAHQLLMEKITEKKLLLVDQMLNIIHMRGDLSAMFVEGGRKTLNMLSASPSQRTSSILNNWFRIAQSKQDALKVYHGGHDIGEDTSLKRGYQTGKYTGSDAGAIFFTPSLPYAKQYQKSPTGLYETELDVSNMFDITNKEHLSRLCNGFLKGVERGDYDTEDDAMRDCERTKSLMLSSTSHEAVDWATASQYIEQMIDAGFDGARFLERPAENIKLLQDGSFELSGPPVYSYAVFKDSVKVKHHESVAGASKCIVKEAGKQWVPDDRYPASRMTRVEIDSTQRARGGYFFVTSCIHSTGEKINSMVDGSEDVSRMMFEGNVNQNELLEFDRAAMYDTGRERGGLRRKNDFAVRYSRGVYDGLPCYYMTHSAIEYIYVTDDDLRVAQPVGLSNAQSTERLSDLVKTAEHITLYHGTNHVFDAKNIKPNLPPYEGSIGRGIYLATTKEVASYHGSNIIEFEANIQNPLVIDVAEEVNYRIAPEIQEHYNQTGRYDSVLMGESIIPFDVLIGGIWYEVRNGYDLEDIGDLALNAGYDAVIVRHLRERSSLDEEILILDQNCLRPGNPATITQTATTESPVRLVHSNNLSTGTIKIPTTDFRKLETLIDRIVKGDRDWTVDDLQLQQNYPEALEVMLRQQQASQTASKHVGNRRASRILRNWLGSALEVELERTPDTQGKKPSKLASVTTDESTSPGGYKKRGLPSALQMRQEGGSLATYGEREQREWLGGIEPPKSGKITLYRATPTGEAIRPGDYVTNSLEYAKLHIESNLGGTGKVAAVEATLSEIFPADGPKEFWYAPQWIE